MPRGLPRKATFYRAAVAGGHVQRRQTDHLLAPRRLARPQDLGPSRSRTTTCGSPTAATSRGASVVSGAPGVAVASPAESTTLGAGERYQLLGVSLKTWATPHTPAEGDHTGCEQAPRGPEEAARTPPPIPLALGLEDSRASIGAWA